MANNSDKIKNYKTNQENQRKYTKKREAEEAKAKEAIHKLVQKVDQDPNNYHHYYDLATFWLKPRITNRLKNY